ncbi:hypothetical protein [Lentzea nigeriaca]|uniref:hypothetical protein n=1 Tax=Lentzea nigeriaca TaxID=1128665 RepID=UPI00195AE9BB|nr:hypothetical protein [Lentzea nigeriaca]MBM7857973.1 hypothetical protein [Lentzea nigeriaca]
MTVARDEDPLWMELKLPAFVDHAFAAFTSDLSEAAGVLNHQFLELFLARDAVAEPHLRVRNRVHRDGRSDPPQGRSADR